MHTKILVLSTKFWKTSQKMEAENTVSLVTARFSGVQLAPLITPILDFLKQLLQFYLCFSLGSAESHKDFVWLHCLTLQQVTFRSLALWPMGIESEWRFFWVWTLAAKTIMEDRHPKLVTWNSCAHCGGGNDMVKLCLWDLWMQSMRSLDMHGHNWWLQ